MDKQSISKKLDSIQSDVKYIRKNLIDIDKVLTDDDIDALDKADKDLKEGKTKGL